MHRRRCKADRASLPLAPAWKGEVKPSIILAHCRVSARRSLLGCKLGVMLMLRGSHLGYLCTSISAQPLALRRSRAISTAHLAFSQRGGRRRGFCGCSTPFSFRQRDSNALQPLAKLSSGSCESTPTLTASKTQFVSINELKMAGLSQRQNFLAALARLLGIVALYWAMLKLQGKLSMTSAQHSSNETCEALPDQHTSMQHAFVHTEIPLPLPCTNVSVKGLLTPNMSVQVWHWAQSLPWHALLYFSGACPGS